MAEHHKAEFRPWARLWLLRAACLLSLALAPALEAQAQMCSDFMKCGRGYRCTKMVTGAITGICTKILSVLPEEKDKPPIVPCHTQVLEALCEKMEHCNWPPKTEACVTKCELRKVEDECRKPGLCLWIPQTQGCIYRLAPK